MLESMIVVCSAMTISFFIQRPHNPLISDMCLEYVDMTGEEIEVVDFAYALIS